MRPAPDLPTILADARTARAWKQRELADVTGIARKRISDFERERSVPVGEELRTLARVLKLSFARLQLASASLGSGCFQTRRNFRMRNANVVIKREWPSEKRYWAAKKAWPDLVESLERRLYARKDARECRVYLREARFDSKLEYLAHLFILDAGAVPDRAAPQLMGFRTLPVVDDHDGRMTGHLRYPALTLAGAVLLPQVTVLTRIGPRRVDLLCGETRGRWRVLEIDGAGHDATEDEDRDKALKIPVRRFEKARITSGRFLTELTAKKAS